MLERTEQTKEKFCIALMNQQMHRNNQCPANHSVEYWGDGIFNIDGEEVETFGIDQRADELFDDGETYVLYSVTYNSFVFASY